MSVKPGAVRWTADTDYETGRIEYSEIVLQSQQRRRKMSGATWYGEPRLCNYWIVKNCFSWGRLSPRQGDYGWLPSIPNWCRRTRWAHLAQPGAASKAGALRDLAAGLRRSQKVWGDSDPDEPNELPYSELIKRVERARKRLK